METEERIAALRRELEPHTALLAEDPSDRYWLTGFASSDGAVVITADGAWFLIDSRYAESAAATVTSCEVRLSRRPNDEIRELLTDAGVTLLYTETEAMTVGRRRRLRDALPGITVSEEDRFDRLLTALRECKSPAELDHIRQAQRMTDETFRYILPRITPGRTEREIMLDMEFYMRGLGSEGVAFDFIVVSGKNSSLPHGVPTDKPVETGDFVTMDFGAVCRGYRSDMTRTVAVGRADEEQRRVYATVLEAQTAAIAAVRAGVPCCDVDRIARDIIAAAGYGEYFGHGLGHGVGIDIHESPAFSPRCTAPARPGTVITVEPGIYLPGRFGVRIEDMVFVTPDGCEDLTASPKELIVL